MQKKVVYKEPDSYWPEDIRKQLIADVKKRQAEERKKTASTKKKTASKKKK